MRHPALILAAALALGTTPTAHAVGRLVDLQIVDRATGETLTPILHDGEWWIAGRPGARYGVTLRSNGRRNLVVLSIDGVNAISGDTAGWDQTGYVVDSHERYEVDGWRKSNRQIAAFEFTALPDSYAARTGRPGNVGVIGIATFVERRRAAPIARRDEVVPTDSRRAAEPVPPPSIPAPAPSAIPSGAMAESPRAAVDAAAKAQADDVAKPALVQRERLGTGHGAIENSTLVDVAFERAQSTPNEVVTIHYDRIENLIAMGIVPASSLPPIAANPFPKNGRFVADPPPR